MNTSSPEIMRRFLDSTVTALDVNLIKRESFSRGSYQMNSRIGSNSIIAFANMFVIANDIFIKECKIDPVHEKFDVVFNRHYEMRVELLHINDKTDFFNYIIQNDAPALTYDDVLKIKLIIEKMNSELYCKWSQQ